MKRYGNLFDQCFTIDSLYIAYKEARKKKRHKPSVIEFEKSLGTHIEGLHRALHDGSYRPEPYTKFTVWEPKERTIYAPSFKDVVVQHAIYRVIYPLYDATFINQSHGCRKEHGTHSASRYAQWAMNQCDDEEYYLQLDIRKFFYSIDRGIMSDLLERRIKDERLLEVMRMFMQMEGERGIPIGNLLSQLYALIYLNPLDHYVKREIGAELYVRYVDDFVIFGIDREEAQALRSLIERFLKQKLNLELSKVNISKIKKGMNFVGYRTWKGYRLVRKRSMYRFRKAVKTDDKEAIASMLGHAKDTASMRRYKTMMEEKRNG